MKPRIIAVFILLTLSLWLASCAPSTGTSVEVSCNDFFQQPHASKQIEVSAGNTFTVTLCSNPTTGYKWADLAAISDETVVRQISHEFIAPENTGVVGAPGKEVWAFKTLKQGTSTISIDYSRPWEGGEKGTWSFNMTVVVK